MIPACILNFAQKHNLLQYFPEIFSRIEMFFPDSRTETELIEDIEEGYFTIFIRIMTSLSVKEAFEQNRQMYRDWELLKDKNFNQYINISTRSQKVDFPYKNQQ